MKTPAILALAVVIALVWISARAEYVFFTPPGSFTIEVSLDNAPYPRLPIYRNAIASLIVTGDLAVGGTASAPGMSPYLFSASLSRARLETILDLTTVIPKQRAILSGFARGGNGTLYAGTIPDTQGDGGHLIEVLVRDTTVGVRDLGVPVPKEGVSALTSDPGAGVLYGISCPSGRFFVHNLADRRTRTFSETVLSRRTLSFLHDYAVEAQDILTRRLALDRRGRVYGSMPINKLFRYDPAEARVTILPDELPEVWGRRPLGRIDAWAAAPDGTLYGGNAADGQLFRLDPETGKVTNLGKPAMMPGMSGLVFGRDGRLYGVTGAPPGYTHLFIYDPRGGGYSDLGNPRFTMTAPGIEQGIAWRGFRIGSLAASEDGKYIVMGEHESLSQLMVFQVR